MPEPWWARRDPICSFCGKINCHELHIWCKTATTTSDSALTPRLNLPTLEEVAAGATVEVYFNEYDGMCPKH